jgi:hypothetical protein
MVELRDLFTEIDRSTVEVRILISDGKNIPKVDQKYK